MTRGKAMRFPDFPKIKELGAIYEEIGHDNMHPTDARQFMHELWAAYHFMQTYQVSMTTKEKRRVLRSYIENEGGMAPGELRKAIQEMLPGIIAGTSALSEGALNNLLTSQVVGFVSAYMRTNADRLITEAVKLAIAEQVKTKFIVTQAPE